MYIGYDFETQGFNPETDAPTEIGMIKFDENFQEVQSLNLFIRSPLTKPQTQEILELTGITDEMINGGVDEGEALKQICEFISDGKVFFAYNSPFDAAFMRALFSRNGMGFNGFTVDAQRDIDYPAKYKCRKLSHLAFDHGIYPEEGTQAHRAVTDVRLMIKLMSKYDIQKAIANAKEPKVQLRIKTPPPWEDKLGNEYAKANGYRFVPETKFWCKEVRESEVEQIIKGSKYPVERL